MMTSHIHQVLVCGGGNAAHVLAALSSLQGYRTNVLTLWQDEAERWSAKHTANNGMTANIEGTKVQAILQHISKDPAKVVPGSNVVVFAMPAFGRELYLNAIRPYLGKECAGDNVMLGAMPAQGGLDWSAKHILGDCDANITLFGLETLPWVCRLQEYGSIVDVMGTKKDVDIGVQPSSAYRQVIDTLSSLMYIPQIGRFPKLNFVGSLLNMTIMNINSVWHPTITYGQYRNWDFSTPFDEPPLFYEGVDDFTAAKLSAVSDEIIALKEKLKSDHGVDLPGVRHIREWMKRSYDGEMEDESSVRAMINTNKGYRGLTHPMIPLDNGKFMPNFKYRYMTEDIPMGLIVTRGIMELAGVESPNMDEVLMFGQRALGKEFLVDGKVQGKDVHTSTCAPQRFGYKTIEEVIDKCGYKQ